MLPNYREVQSVEARIRKAELENVFSMRQRIVEGTKTEPGVPLFWLHAMLNSETLKNIIQGRRALITTKISVMIRCSLIKIMSF